MPSACGPCRAPPLEPLGEPRALGERPGAIEGARTVANDAPLLDALRLVELLGGDSVVHPVLLVRRFWHQWRRSYLPRPRHSAHTRANRPGPLPTNERSRRRRTGSEPGTDGVGVSADGASSG